VENLKHYFHHQADATTPKYPPNKFHQVNFQLTGEFETNENAPIAHKSRIYYKHQKSQLMKTWNLNLFQQYDKSYLLASPPYYSNCHELGLCGHTFFYESSESIIIDKLHDIFVAYLGILSLPSSLVYSF
jgi:hypothetical protein